jgi:hypothetical protein
MKSGNFFSLRTSQRSMTVPLVRTSRGAFARYYFTIGRGKTKAPITKIWYTWRGRMLGSFVVDEIVRNDGSLPKLRSLSDEESGWQIKPYAWVAICMPGCDRLRDRVFMSSFRGWRYFDIASYQDNPESRIRF